MDLAEVPTADVRSSRLGFHRVFYTAMMQFKDRESTILSRTDAKKDHCLSSKLLLMFVYIDFVASREKKGKGEDCVYVKSGIGVFFDKSRRFCHPPLFCTMNFQTHSSIPHFKV